MSATREMLRERVLEALDSCDDAELWQLVRMVRAIEKRRRILGALGVTPAPADVRVEVRRDRSRRHEVMRGLRELRDSETWSQPRPQFTVIDGGSED